MRCRDNLSNVGCSEWKGDTDSDAIKKASNQEKIEVGRKCGDEPKEAGDDGIN